MARTVRIVSRLQLMPARVARLVPLPSKVARPEPPDIVHYTGCHVRGTSQSLVSVSEVLRALGIETESVGAAVGLRTDDTDTRLKIGPEADLVMPKCAALIAQHRLDPDEARRLPSCRSSRPESGPKRSAGTLGADQTAILPPPFFVIATTEGRGGMSGLKSGQRVEGCS